MREQRRVERETRLRAMLVDGPVTVLPLAKMSIEFDPNRATPLGEHGTVYDGLRVNDIWGRLNVGDAGLIAADWKSVRLPGPAIVKNTTLAGPGWSVALAPGWRLVSGDRKGDQTIVAAP